VNPKPETTLLLPEGRKFATLTISKKRPPEPGDKVKIEGYLFDLTLPIPELAEQIRMTLCTKVVAFKRSLRVYSKRKLSEIKWVAREYIGVEVLTAPPGMSRTEVLQGKSNWPKDFEPVPITDKDAVHEGSVVLIPHPLGGMGAYQIKKNEDGTLSGHSGSTMALLGFGEDERQCWVCGGLMNLDSIMRLDIFK
jgi:hypothetical protein